MNYDTQVAVSALREYAVDGGMKLNLHYGQVEAWNATERFIAIISGTQGGKTSFAPNWLLREIKLRGNGDYLYVTPTFTLLDKKALPEFLEVFEKHGKLGRWYPSKMKFVFHKAGMEYVHGKNKDESTFDKFDPLKPTTVYFGYAKKPESLESMTAKAAVLDEAGQEDFKLDSWFAILRRLSIHRGRVLIGTTPYNFGWLYTHVYQRWMAGDKDYRVVNFPSIANPMFPIEEAERAKNSMPYWKYAMFYLGKFTKPAGLIYDIFDNDVHVIKPFKVPNHWFRIGAIDFGGQNKAATFYAVEPQTQIAYLYKEYFPQQYKPLRDHAVDMLADKANVYVNRDLHKVQFSSDHWRFIAGAKGEQQWRIELAQHGLMSSPSYVHSVELGIDKAYSVIKRGRIKVFDTCVMTINEFNTYSREVDVEGNPIENTIKDKTTFHLLDTYRYFGSYFGNSAVNPDWTDTDVNLLHPDGLEADIQRLLDNENVDLDSPAVQRILRRHNANQHQVMMKHYRKDELESPADDIDDIYDEIYNN